MTIAIPRRRCAPPPPVTVVSPPALVTVTRRRGALPVINIPPPPPPAPEPPTQLELPLPIPDAPRPLSPHFRANFHAGARPRPILTGGRRETRYKLEVFISETPSRRVSAVMFFKTPQERQTARTEIAGRWWPEPPRYVEERIRVNVQ